MIIKVKVKPNSQCNRLIKISDGSYFANVKEPAEANRANKALIKLLCREFGVNFKRIKIKNPSSRDKTIEI